MAQGPQNFLKIALDSKGNSRLNHQTPAALSINRDAAQPNQTATNMNEGTLVLRDFAGKIETTPEALHRKQELIAKGKEITQVTNTDEQTTALAAHRGLKALRVEVEAQRKAIKAPVLALGKQIDDVAATFIADAEKVEKYLEGHINHYQQKLQEEQRRREQEAEQQRLAAERAALDAQRAQQEAERKRLEAERLELEAQQMKAGKRQEAAQAEADRIAEEARRLQEEAIAKELEAESIPEPIVAQVEQTKGVTAKEVKDYLVLGSNEFEQHKNLILFAAKYPNLVKVEIRRRDLLDAIANGTITEAPGIQITSNLKTTIR